MLCQNCGNHEANVKYTQIINGVKKEMSLCEECAKKLGIENQLHFNIPMDLPSFLGGFLEEYDNSDLLPNFNINQELTCPTCGMTYDEFITAGKLGCGECYEVFSDKIDPILKNLQGSNRHIGRKGKITAKSNPKKEIKLEEKQNTIGKEDKMKGLKEKLKQAIKEEKYEEAAKLRDEIKKIEDK